MNKLGTKRIIHIISSLRRGGRERQLATIVANTDSSKYPTKIICFNSSQDSYVDEYNLFQNVIKVDSKNFFHRLFKLNKVIKQNKPDVVYTWGNIESFLILLLRPFHGFSFINGSIRHGIRARKLSHYFRTLILHLSKNLVANSYAGIKANKLKRGYVLYNGIDNKFFTPLKNRSSKRKDLVNISEGALLFVSVANLVPYKDYYTVLTALRSIKNEYPDFHYLILGDGPLRKNLENFIKECGLKKNVTILGNVENVRDYLEISDIFIHSSKGEGCSNAILEAMAAGLPVIATNTGGTPEIVNNRFGILFDFQNSNQLIHQLQGLLSEKKKIEEFGMNARKEIEAKYSIKKMLFNYYRIIEKIVSCNN